MELAMRLGVGRKLDVGMRHLDVVPYSALFREQCKPMPGVPTHGELTQVSRRRMQSGAITQLSICKRDVMNAAATVLLPTFHFMFTTPSLPADKVLFVGGWHQRGASLLLLSSSRGCPERTASWSIGTPFSLRVSGTLL